MSIFLFSQKTAPKVTLLLDIGSKSVGGAIFEKTPKGEARLLYAVRQDIPFQKELTGRKFLSALFKSLDAVLLHLEKYAVNHLPIRDNRRYRIDSAAIFFSSPWHSSETKVLKLKLKKPHVVTKAMIEELIAVDEEPFEERGEGKDAGQYELFERKIIEIRLDGFPTAKPYRKTAGNIEVNMFSSSISAEILKKIKSAAERRFPIENFSFNTFSLAAFSSLRDFFRETEDFLIAQVGGEVTDITVVNGGIVAEMVCLPLGHNGLLRGLAEICVADPHCTLETLFTLHREGIIAGREKIKVEQAIADAKALCSEHFSNAVSNFSEETFLPKSVFLFEEGPYAPVFEEFFRGAEFGRFASAAEPLAVKVIDRNMAAQFSQFDKNVFADQILAMEADFSARVD